MKQVFSSTHSEQVGLMRSILDSAGISCDIRNDAVSQVMIGFPFASELWILRDEDYGDAMALVAEFKRETPTDSETEPTPAIPPGVALKQFRTNTRLWLLISLGLFVAPWFIMDISGDGVNRPFLLWFVIFSNTANSGQVFSRIIAFTLLFGLSALAIGWVLQCFISLIRNAFIKRNLDDA
jgi:hypothetical protein